MLNDYVTEVIGDPNLLIDAIVSMDGVMAIGGLTGLAMGTTMLNKFFSGGPKNWLSPYEAWRAGFYGDKHKGIILGRYNGSLICDTSSNHVGIDGSTGTGKTACTFLATLLMNTYFGWMIFDQSGDLWRLTSGRRATYGPVYRLYPGLENTHYYNPFTDIPNDSRIVSNLTAIYEPLFSGSANDQKQTGGNPFFKNSAKGILPFITIQVLYGEDASKKNIGGVLEYIDDGETCFRDMARNPRHPKCAAIGRQYIAMNEATRTSIMSSLYDALSLWRDESICKMTETSSFSVASLATSKEGPISIYLCAPATDLKRILPFYSMMEELLKIHLMNNKFNTLDGTKKVREVCISDDEAQNTNRPDINSLEIQRKYGLRSLLGYQSIHAMGNKYGADKLGLLKTKVSLRPPSDPDDIYVKKIVSLSGTYKKKVVSESQNSGKSGGSRGRSWRIEERPRLTKLDLENWPKFGNGLLTHDGRPAIIKTFDSEQDKEFKPLIMSEAYVNVTWPIQSHWKDISSEVVAVSGIEEDDDEDGFDTEGHGMVEVDTDKTQQIRRAIF